MIMVQLVGNAYTEEKGERRVSEWILSCIGIQDYSREERVIRVNENR